MGVKLYALAFAAIFVFLASVFVTLYFRALYDPSPLDIQVGVYVEACDGSMLQLRNIAGRSVNHTLFEVFDYSSGEPLQYAIFVSFLDKGEADNFNIIDRLAPTVTADINTRGSGQYSLVSSVLPPSYFTC
jgi:hypothetical protein